MTPALRANLRLAALSVGVTTALLVGGFEFIKSREYDQWKASYEQTGALYDRMTVASDDPKLIWAYKPYGEFADYGLKVNRWGFRDRDFETKAKPDGVYRVAFVGDSVTLGLWTGEPYTFVRQFEVIANDLAPEKPVQALNISVDGYDARQVGELVRARALDYQPDKVVYGLHLNDFDFEGSAGDKLYYFRKPVSFLWLYVTYAFDVMFRHRATMEYHAFHFAKHKDEVFNEILAMRDLLRQKGIAFEVAVLPVFKDWPEYPLRTEHAEIDTFLQSAGIAYVDLAPEFLTEQKDIPTFSVDVWHPNARGHRLIAERLVEPVLGPEMAIRGMPYALDVSRPANDSYLDLSALPDIVPSAGQRARKEAGLFEEQFRLDGPQGFLVTEYGLGASFNPEISARLDNPMAFMQRMRSFLAQGKGTYTMGQMVPMEGPRMGGYYALYQTPSPEAEGTPQNCLFGLVGYRFGAATAKSIYDAYVLVDYCAKGFPEEKLARFLETVKPRPATPPQRPKS
jgi:lysophospholipase L1-like esterase